MRIKTGAAAESGVAVKLSEIPPHRVDTLASATLHAVERFFALPGVQEDYEKWLVEYRKRKEVKT